MIFCLINHNHSLVISVATMNSEIFQAFIDELNYCLFHVVKDPMFFVILAVLLTLASLVRCPYIYILKTIPPRKMCNPPPQYLNFSYFQHNNKSPLSKYLSIDLSKFTPLSILCGSHLLVSNFWSFLKKLKS